MSINSSIAKDEYCFVPTCHLGTAIDLHRINVMISETDVNKYINITSNYNIGVIAF